MQNELILWGRKEGEPEYLEDIITSEADTAKIEKAKQWAITQGYKYFRVSQYNGEKPDFIGTIKKIDKP